MNPDFNYSIDLIFKSGMPYIDKKPPNLLIKISASASLVNQQTSLVIALTDDNTVTSLQGDKFYTFTIAVGPGYFTDKASADSNQSDMVAFEESEPQQDA